jgi:lysozyme family protein
LTSKFLRCIEFVLGHEGGYVNDVQDPGGETRYGISKRSFPNVDINNLTLNAAKEIYFIHWWDRYGYENIGNERIAEKVLDLSVNMGQSAAVRHLQNALNVFDKHLEVDGSMGQKTFFAVNSIPEHETERLYILICIFAAQYYFALNKPHFIKGWLRRAASCKKKSPD